MPLPVTSTPLAATVPDADTRRARNWRRDRGEGRLGTIALPDVRRRPFAARAHGMQSSPSVFAALPGRGQENCTEIVIVIESPLARFTAAKSPLTAMFPPLAA